MTWTTFAASSSASVGSLDSNLLQAATAQTTYCTGVANVGGAYTATSVLPLTAYVSGMVFSFIASADASASSTLNINSLGAVTLYDDTNQAILAGAFFASDLVTVQYNGVTFSIIAIHTPRNRYSSTGTKTNNATSIDSTIADIILVSDASSTTVTGITGGKSGRTIRLIFQNGNTTISTSAATLKSATNFVGALNSTLQLTYLSGAWVETGRSVL